MRVADKGEKFWRAGGASGWRRWTDADATTLAVSDAHGLRLTADPQGPLSLQAADGSAGGLVLPRGMAFDAANTLYLLVAGEPGGAVVKRFEPESRTFVALPEVGGDGSAPRRLSDPRDIAIAGDRLYVADTGNRRVQAFDLASLALVEIIGATGERAGWEPVDLAVHDEGVYVLDAARARVYRRARTGQLALQLEVPQRAGKWSRVLVDRIGTIYLLNATVKDRPVLETADPHAPPVADAAAVRDLFASPELRLDAFGRFYLPEPLMRVCGRSKAAQPRARTPMRTTRTAQGWWLLYVVEREQSRVNAYTAAGRRLRHSWGCDLDWQPCDVAAFGRVAYVLDERGQTVYRHQAGQERLRVVVAGDPAATVWSRVAVDETGRICVWAPGAANVQVFDARGTPCAEQPYRDVARWFERTQPAAPPAAGSGAYFTRAGTPVASVDPSEPAVERPYRTSGVWQSAPFDSGEHRCQWHRVEIGLSNFPPSSRIDVATFAHDAPLDVRLAPDDAWQSAHTLVAPLQQSPAAPPPPSLDVLVRSGAAQYLSVRIALASDGFGTPAVETMKLFYPRDSYLQYLPAIFSEDDEGRVFLERFLAIFQTEFDRFDRVIGEEEKYFDPDAVPDGPFLEYLASQWLGLRLEQTWNEQQKRRLLSAIPKIYQHHGQAAGLRELVAVYLANVSGLETADVRAAGFPTIVESFRERRFAMTSGAESSRLGHGAPLWSDSVVRRLQVGVFSREGEAALVSTGDPAHDVFDRYAHRFVVNVPARWVRASSDERMLRRAIESEKPAHTSYELRLLDARFRVGEQSTVGVDTIVGAGSATTLSCGACDDVPAGGPPSGRLGYDTVLSGRAGWPDMRNII
jgi:phage tail-like protein